MMTLIALLKQKFKNAWQRKDITLRLILAWIMLFVSCHSYMVQAAFEDLGVGARAPGMADSFVAASDDVNALYYNPAGLIQVGERQVATQYGEYVKGLDDGSKLGATYLGYVHPIHQGVGGTLGFGYHNFNAANLFTERMLLLSYGWRLRVQPFGTRGIPSLGLTLKQLHREYEPDRFTENSLNDVGTATGKRDPLFAGNGYSKDNYSLDLGGLYQFGDNYRKSVGFSITNLNRPDVSIQGDGDNVPMIAKFGLAYRPIWGLMSAEVRRAKRLQSASDTDLALGAERKFSLADWGAIHLRGGYAQGSRGFKNITAGASYLFSKAQLDYAFNFPVGNLVDTQGSHRIGLTFHMGMPATKLLSVDESANQDLLLAFERNSTAAHLIIKRININKSLSDYQRSLLLRILMRKLAQNDPQMANIRKELFAVLRNPDEILMDWPSIKLSLLKDLAPEDQANADQSLELFAKGANKNALARLALVSSPTRRDKMVTSMALISLTELAAQSYRAKSLEDCIESVRQILEMLPQDEVVEKAYRQLLVEQTRLAPPISLQPEKLPEAPQTLVAPKPVNAEPANVWGNDMVIHAKSYGIALGYYFTRKTNGASAFELETLLKQMKAVYGELGFDMGLINTELSQLPKDKPELKPTPQPEQKPEIKKTEVAPKAQEPKVVQPKVAPPKPKAASNPLPKTVLSPSLVVAIKAALNKDVEHAMDFYKELVNRGISDYERIEILQAILNRFGDDGTAKAKRDLDRLRSRLE